MSFAWQLLGLALDIILDLFAVWPGWIAWVVVFAFMKGLLRPARVARSVVFGAMIALLPDTLSLARSLPLTFLIFLQTMLIIWVSSRLPPLFVAPYGPWICISLGFILTMSLLGAHTNDHLIAIIKALKLVPDLSFAYITALFPLDLFWVVNTIPLINVARLMAVLALFTRELAYLYRQAFLIAQAFEHPATQARLAITVKCLALSNYFLFLFLCSVYRMVHIRARDGHQKVSVSPKPRYLVQILMQVLGIERVSKNPIRATRYDLATTIFHIKWPRRKWPVHSADIWLLWSPIGAPSSDHALVYYSWPHTAPTNLSSYFGTMRLFSSWKRAATSSIQYTYIFRPSTNRVRTYLSSNRHAVASCLN